MHVAIVRTLLALGLTGTAACSRSASDTSNPAFATGPAPVASAPVSLSLERPGGSPFPSFAHLGNTYVAGDIGSRYELRLTNHTNERVEAVVTVDGRDVISGDLGNYKRQRGYVIEPYSSVVVTGFRQSLDQVAAFRFTDLQASYTAQWGTPQHAGVVGVALFREKERRRRPNKALTTAPEGPEEFAREESPFPGVSPGRSAAKSAESGPADSAASEDAAMSPQAEPSAGGGRDFAPAPPRSNELGTEYGESVASSVREIDFKRRHRRKPDAFVTVYYDSLRGLEARGVPVHGQTAPIAADPNPFPG